MFGVIYRVLVPLNILNAIVRSQVLALDKVRICLCFVSYYMTYSESYERCSQHLYKLKVFVSFKDHYCYSFIWIRFSLLLLMSFVQYSFEKLYCSLNSLVTLQNALFKKFHLQMNSFQYIFEIIFVILRKYIYITFTIHLQYINTACSQSFQAYTINP